MKIKKQKHTGPGKKHGGFTIVELLVALVAASILAITAGVLIFSFFKSMRQSREAVELQRDGAAAMAYFNQWVRETSIESVSTTLSTLTISNESPLVVSQFYKVDQNLVFDPDIAIASNEFTIIQGRLDRFVPIKDNDTASVTIELDLVSGETKEEIRSRLKPRN